MLRLTSFGAMISIIHSDSTERFKRLRLDAAEGYLSVCFRWTARLVRQIWRFLKLYSKLTYIKCLVDQLKGLLYGLKVLLFRCIGSGSRQ